MLAAWRAGLTVAALPMLWRGYEIGKACEEIAPKALIGVSRCAGENHAENLCAIAASQLSVRFVLGFGPDLPDGVVSLDEVIEGARKGSAPGRGAAMRRPTACHLHGAGAACRCCRCCATRTSCWRKAR